MRKIIFVWLCLFAVLPARSAFSAGSGAYRLEVPDAGAMGMGAAFVAQADTPSAVYYNPAGLTQLKDSRFYATVGTAVIQPFCTYTDNAGNETQRRKQIFNVPHGFFVSDFGLERFSFGVGATSFWGLGTYWAQDSFSKYVATKSDVITQDGMFSGAYKINDHLSIGASADIVKSLANKKKKLLQLGGPDGDFQLKGKDNGSWGWRLSALYKLNEKHSFGLMYRSPVDLKYKGKVYLNDLNAAGLNYLAIFGAPSYETDVTSDSKLPQSFVVGYCFKPDDRWRFEFDMEWMDWSSVQEEKLNYPSEANPFRLMVLNTGNPVPRDWHGAFSYALGTQYKVNDRWKLRAGYFFHQTPIPQANFDTALPDSTSNSVTVGTGFSFTKNISIDFAYAAMFYNSRDIDNDVGAGSGASIDGKYESFNNIYMVTLNFKL